VILSIKKSPVLALFISVSFIVATLIVLSTSTSAQSIPTDGLTLHYSFDDINNTTVNDSSGNGRTASIFGGAEIVPGRMGNGLDFDGTNYIISGDGFNYPTSGGSTYNYVRSISLWFKTSSTNGIIFGQVADSTEPGVYPGGWIPAISVGTDGKLREILFWDGPANPNVSVNTYNDGQWHHMVGIYNNDGTDTLFIDGVQVSQRIHTQNPYAGSYRYYFGTGFGSSWPGMVGTWLYFIGSIDEIRVYNRVLTQNEITALYSESTYVPPPYEPPQPPETWPPATGTPTPSVTPVPGQVYTDDSGNILDVWPSPEPIPAPGSTPTQSPSSSPDPSGSTSPSPTPSGSVHSIDSDGNVIEIWPPYTPPPPPPTLTPTPTSGAMLKMVSNKLARNNDNARLANAAAVPKTSLLSRLFGLGRTSESKIIPVAHAQPVTSYPLKGWAWASNFGWLSFNSVNISDGDTYPYSVSLDPDGNFDGYAWSPNIGWISFKSTDVSYCGSTAKVDFSTGKVTGYARAITAINYNQPTVWDGCIAMSDVGQVNPKFSSPDTSGDNGDSSRGVTYKSVRLNSSQVEGKFSGFGWASGLGWITWKPTFLLSNGAISVICTPLSQNLPSSGGSISVPTSSGQGTASASGGSGTYEYQWSDGRTGFSGNWNQMPGTTFPTYPGNNTPAAISYTPIVKARDKNNTSLVSTEVACGTVTVAANTNPNITGLKLLIGSPSVIGSSADNNSAITQDINESIRTYKTKRIKPGESFALRWNMDLPSSYDTCRLLVNPNTDPGLNEWVNEGITNPGAKTSEFRTYTGTARGMYEFTLKCDNSSTGVSVHSTTILQISSSSETEF